MPADHQTAPRKRCPRCRLTLPAARLNCMESMCPVPRPATGERVDAEAAPRECGWAAGLNPIVHCELPRGHAGPHSFDPPGAAPPRATTPEPWTAERLERALDHHGIVVIGEYAFTHTAAADLAVWPKDFTDQTEALAVFYDDYDEAIRWITERATLASSPRVDGPAGAMSEERLAEIRNTPRILRGIVADLERVDWPGGSCGQSFIDDAADAFEEVLAEIDRLRAAPPPEIGALVVAYGQACAVYGVTGTPEDEQAVTDARAELDRAIAALEARAGGANG